MNEQLKLKLNELPEAPGIYQMLDKSGNIIYIGKSKCLKKRVHSYFVPSPVWDKAKKLVPFVEDINIIVTDTHLEAMLLECDLIKKRKPHFNSVMKNDERYCYLTLEENCRRNPLKITSVRENLSFGPFRSKRQLQEVIDTLRNLYPITKEKSRYLFEYHIFPCIMEKESFLENQKLLARIFSRKTELTRFLQAIEREMKQAAKEQYFEQALHYRDLKLTLTWLQGYLIRLEEWTKTDLIYAVPLSEGYKFFYISDGRIVCSEKASENTKDSRQQFTERVVLEKEKLSQNQTEKELLDYRSIVFGELGTSPDMVYLIE